MNASSARLTPFGWGLILLSTSLVFLLSSAFVPIEEFVHRGDDAFYYFKVAVNFPTHGFWTFDGIHSTNGVQPLWAMILTVVAYPLHWLRVSDPTAARVFVGLAAALHFVSGLMIYRLLARTVSIGTGLAVAGGLLFPLAIVWSHVWGMENAIYATLLIATVSFYHFGFLKRAQVRTALLLGVLLGLTALSRLNAGLLVPFMGLAYLVSGPRQELGRRVKLGLVVSLGVAALVVPYVAWNLATTGHLLPISGSVKSVKTAQWLADIDVETRPSRDYFSAVFYRWRRPIERFISSRGLDGLWALGFRIPFKDTLTAPMTLALTTRVVFGTLAALLIAPLALGRPRSWARYLWKRISRLGRFWYVAAFAAFNSALSVLLYPTEVYAITAWWLAECELVIVVVMATLMVASVSYIGRQRLGRGARLGVAFGTVALLAAYHGADTIRFYFDGVRHTYDWNQSWNDQGYAAAMWMNENLPEDALVGSWNAGVVGYYTERPVVNLDGLINNEDLLRFIEAGTVADYIRREGIRYLADLEPMFGHAGVLEDLSAVPIYASFTAWGQRYLIYEIVE